MCLKQKRTRNKKYLRWVQGCPCIACLMESKGLMNTADNISDPHHVSKQGHGAMSSKTDDSRVIPLCHHHHLEAHSIGRDSFADKYYINYEEVIDGLNRIYKRMAEV